MKEFELIRKWAEDRNLIKGSSPQAQMLKLFEEGGELAGAIAKGKAVSAFDGIGDMVVVLTILAEQMGTSIEWCTRLAYNEIKDRKGHMENGVFIKEEN